MISIYKLFVPLRKVCWISLRDNKKLRFKSKVCIAICFFVISPNGTKLGIPIDSIEYPFCSIFHN